MSKSRFFRLIFVGLAIIILTSCSEFRKVQKSSDWKEKYNAAIKYYKEKDYYRAITLLEEILPIIRGTEEAELANYYYAYSYFHDRQYLMSTHYFKQFYEVYSRSDKAMECKYMYAYSLYMQSPIYTLDQSSTHEAIAAMQTFLNQYPYSEYAQSANDIIDKLQVKLETKAADIAKSYFKLRRYKSALVAFDNFKKDFPDSKYNEEISLLEINSAYALAKQSISTKQKERYKKAVELYLAFIDRYPNSKLQKSAEQFYDNSIEEMRKFATNN